MKQSFDAESSERFIEAVRQFDEQNSKDPHELTLAGKALPRELAYSQWLTDWVQRLKPDASEALRLAARSAHLCRWAISRDNYPKDRAGYLRWRQDLKGFHAQKVGDILKQVGYEREIIGRVQGLVSKQSFPADPESRVLEDALCLVFLEHQFADLAAKSTDEKMINALQKTWKKMTPAAKAIALKLDHGAHEKALLQQALGI